MHGVTAAGQARRSCHVYSRIPQQPTITRQAQPTEIDATCFLSLPARSPPLPSSFKEVLAEVDIDAGGQEKERVQVGASKSLPTGDAGLPKAPASAEPLPACSAGACLILPASRQ